MSADHLTYREPRHEDGARFQVGEDRTTRPTIRHILIYGGSDRIRTMMQLCASNARLRSSGPILCVGIQAMGKYGIPLPRIVFGSRLQQASECQNQGFLLSPCS